MKRSEIYNKDFDDVWQKVVKACSETDVSIKDIRTIAGKTREKVSGIITAERSILATEELRETFETGQVSLIIDEKEPARLMGSGVPSFVARTGKVVDSKVIELDLLSELEKQSVFVIFSYNIICRRNG